MSRTVFVAGGIGYVGHPLIERLPERGRRVRALVRRGSEARLPAGATPVIGDALDATTFADQDPAGAPYVQLARECRGRPGSARPSISCMRALRSRRP